MHIKNLGPISDVSINLSDLTLFIGDNGTGKTLASYALYSFRNWLEQGVKTDLIKKQDIDSLILNNQPIIEPTDQYKKKLTDSLISSFNALNNDGNYFSDFFKDDNIYIKGTTKIEIDESDINSSFVSIPFDDNDASNTHWTYNVRTEDSNNVYGQIISRFVSNGEKIKISYRNIGSSIVNPKEQNNDSTLWSKNYSNEINLLVFATLFDISAKNVYLPAERIGINMFRKRLNNQFINNNLVEPKSNLDSTQPSQENERYPYPIESYIKFLNESLNSISKPHTSDINGDSEGLLSHLIPGQFKYNSNSDQLTYDLSSSNTKTVDDINFGLLSSSLKSLFGIDLFIKGRKENDWLFIDEPEMNLHPKRQTEIMKLLYLLMINGSKLVISTHSDYMVKELINKLLETKLSNDTSKRVTVYQFENGSATKLNDISSEDTLNNFDDSTNKINAEYYDLIDRITSQEDAKDE